MDYFSFVIGVISTSVIFSLFNIIRQSGYLRIDTSDPDKDFYLLNITKDLEKIKSKKSIIIKIDTKYKKPISPQ